jgi:hypothetical protein
MQCRAQNVTGENLNALKADLLNEIKKIFAQPSGSMEKNGYLIRG